MLVALGGSIALHGLVLFAIPVSPQAQGTRVSILQAQLLPAAASVTAGGQPAAGKAQASVTPLTAAGLTTAAAVHEPALVTAQAPALQAEATPAQTAALAQPDAPAYFSGAELDVPPHMLGEVQQIYPARARSAAVEGFVTLALLINERGEVEQASVVQAQPGGYFEEAALAMLRKQRFSPPIKHNQPVKSRWLTTVRYRLQG
jgi:TonB family protein